MDTGSLTRLTNHELLARLKRLLHDERQATAAVVAHLGEVEERKLYLEEGRASLFTYCTQVLHLSEHAAYNRIEAARVARRFPAVLVALEHGHVHLSAIKLLASLLTAENHKELLAAAKHKSKREVEELIARWHPQPDAATSVRKLPGARTNGSCPSPGAGGHGHPSANGNDRSNGNGNGRNGDHSGNRGHNGTASDTGSLGLGQASRDDVGLSGRSAVVEPLSPDRYKVQFTTNAATRDRLRRAQELLQHRIPGGDVAKVIELALEHLVRELEKSKFAATDRPPRRVRATGSASRSISASVKRAVWKRDRGRCAFVSTKGVRCTESGRLEFDHVHPYGDGGPPTVDNVRLLCRAHNLHQAREFYGPWRADSRATNARGARARDPTAVSARRR